MKNRLLPVFFILILGFASGSDQCFALSIQVSPSPVILGYTASYSLVGTFKGQVSSYYWEYRSNDGVCLTPWGRISSNPNLATQNNLIESVPGTFDIRCTITYASVMGQPAPPPDIISTSITIAPPNGFRIAVGPLKPTGLNTIAPSATSIEGCTGVTLIFVIQSNTKDCGQYIAGQPQELITNKVLYGIPRADDPDWSPAGYDARFHLSTNTIQDFKTVAIGQAEYYNWPRQSVFYTRTQHLRILMTDLCGNQKIYSLNSVNLQSQKIDDDTWQLLQP